MSNSADPSRSIPHLERREYLHLASGAITTTAGYAALQNTAVAAEYDTITVAAGETFTKSLSNGETWENKLIDITADGAAYEIEARTDNWTIRNIGIKGTYPNRSGEGVTPFIVHVESPDATGTIENVYLGDGDVGETYDTSGAAQAVGLFVDNSHAGHLDIRNLYVSNWSNNGVYGSAPGNPASDKYPGEGGTVTIDTAYAENNDVAGFRLGTAGSTLTNCVTVGNRKGFWAYYEEIDAVNCDAYHNNKSSFTINEGVTLHLSECRATGSPDWGHLNNMGTVHGSLAGNARSTPPQGVPTSPVAAARPTGSSPTQSVSSSTSSSSSASDYDIIRVPEGETFTEDSPEFDLQDGGTWENKLIDITADGAGAFINVKTLGLTNWTIRNIGVTGINEGHPHATFWVADIKGGSSRLENIYIGDGDGYPGHGPGQEGANKPSGIFVHPEHSGDLVIDHLNVQNFDDNGVYASAPGRDKAEAADGNVIIQNSFGKGCDSSVFRLAEGTDKSMFKNCVAISSPSARGFWAENGDVYAVNCDSSGNNQQYCVGSSDSRATLHVTNCRADADAPVATWNVCTAGTFDGDFGSHPRTSPPAGVPRTAIEAARGAAGSSTTTSQSEPSTSGEWDLLRLVSHADTTTIEYEFTVDGQVQLWQGNEKHEAEQTNDSVTQNADGTVTVRGGAGNGYGDTYLVQGSVTEMQLDEQQWDVLWNNAAVTVDEVTGNTSGTARVTTTQSARETSTSADTAHSTQTMHPSTSTSTSTSTPTSTSGDAPVRPSGEARVWQIVVRLLQRLLRVFFPGSPW